MRRAGLLAVALMALLVAGQSGSAKTRGVLAIVGLGSKMRLGYVNPATLKLIGKSTEAGSFNGPASRSPDGSQLAIAQSKPSGILIVDLRRMRTVRAFKLSDGVSRLAWVGPRRIIVVSEGLPVLAVDPVTGRRLWERNLPTFPEAVGRSTNGLVLLSPPADDYQDATGPSTLTTVSSARRRAVSCARSDRHRLS